MTDYGQKLLPRFRYGVIQPRAHEDVQRARSYQLYRLLPLDFIEISTGLELENIRRKASSSDKELPDLSTLRSHKSEAGFNRSKRFRN